MFYSLPSKLSRFLAFLLLVTLAACGSQAAPSPSRQAGSQRSPARLSLHRLWTQNVSPNADSAPAYRAGVRTRLGRRAVVYVLAANNTDNCNPGNPVRRATTYAFDAATGRPLWSQSTSGPARCSTAGPAVDPSGTWIYAPGLDGKVHRYNAGTGAEYRSHGWPIRYTLMPDVEKAAATFTVRGRYLYVTTSGFIGDQGHYQGHLVTIDLTSNAVHVFNSLCSNIHALLGPTSSRSNYCPDERSGLFGRGQGVTDPVTHDVYIVSGNGAWNGRTNWGDSLLKLDPSGSRLLDAFTPTNQASLDASDLDLGSTGPALLPTIKQGSRAYHLLVQGGKGPACDGCRGAAVRLLNRDNLSGRGGPGHLGGDLQDVQAPGGCEVLTAPAVWHSARQGTWIFYANSCGTAGYRLTSPARGTFRLQRVWGISTSGTTPIVSHGVLYLAHDGQVTAYSPTNHAVLATLTGLAGLHWEYPRIAGNRLFITDESGHLVAASIGG